MIYHAFIVIKLVKFIMVKSTMFGNLDNSDKHNAYEFQVCNTLIKEVIV